MPFRVGDADVMKPSATMPNATRWCHADSVSGAAGVMVSARAMKRQISQTRVLIREAT